MTPEKIHEFRKRAVAWLEFACAGNPPVDSPRHLVVKENRRVKGYSSCADLAHWMYFRLGIRLPFINRDEHNGWKQQVNVSRLAAKGKPYTGEKLEGGDVIIIANDWPKGSDSHVVCVIDQPYPDKLDTAESGLPSNGLQRRTLPMGRKIRVVLPLADILQEAEQQGCLI